MATQFFVFFLLLSCHALTFAAGDDTDFGSPLDPNSLGLNKTQQLTHFRLYWHETLAGPNATSVAVVQPIARYNSSDFGQVGIFDNALTLGPESSSKIVGRAEGLYASTSQTEFHLFPIQSFVFFEGKYNGSTIIILGRNVAFNATRELPVVGGSGVFRFATGYAQLRTHFSDRNAGNTIVEYNVYVYHY